MSDRGLLCEVPRTMTAGVFMHRETLVWRQPRVHFEFSLRGLDGTTLMMRCTV
jgi:hypothetical protein